MSTDDGFLRISRRKKLCRTRWTPAEDTKLKQLVATHGEDAWQAIAKEIPNRSCMQCATRWNKCLSPNIIKGQWTVEDDDTLRNLVNHIGPKNWTVIASYLPGRIGKQCRERWHNHLDPKINKAPWTGEEDELICKLYGDLGSQWNKIASALPGRTDNSVKNHFNSTLRKYYGKFPARKRKEKESTNGESVSVTSVNRSPPPKQTRMSNPNPPPLKIISVCSLSTSPQKPTKLTANKSQFGPPRSSKSLSFLKQELPPMESEFNEDDEDEFEDEDEDYWEEDEPESKVDPLLQPDHVDVKPYLKPLEGVLLATWICDTCNHEFSTYEALEVHMSGNQCSMGLRDIRYEQDSRRHNSRATRTTNR